MLPLSGGKDMISLAAVQLSDLSQLGQFSQDFITWWEGWSESGGDVFCWALSLPPSDYLVKVFPLFRLRHLTLLSMLRNVKYMKFILKHLSIHFAPGKVQGHKVQGPSHPREFPSKITWKAPWLQTIFWVCIAKNDAIFKILGGIFHVPTTITHLTSLCW